MSKYEVIQDFKGSPDGHTVIQFTKGSEIDRAELGDDLAGVALAEKWVKPSKSAEKEAKAKAKEKAQAEEAERIKAQSIAALQAEIDQLNAGLNAAADAGDDTDPVVAQIEAKQAELDALLA